MQSESCPHCGERQGFLPVQRTTLSGGGRYERYFCCHCKSSFERDPETAWMQGSVPVDPAASSS